MIFISLKIKFRMLELSKKKRQIMFSSFSYLDEHTWHNLLEKAGYLEDHFRLLPALFMIIYRS